MWAGHVATHARMAQIESSVRQTAPPMRIPGGGPSLLRPGPEPEETISASSSLEKMLENPMESPPEGGCVIFTTPPERLLFRVVLLRLWSSRPSFTRGPKSACLRTALMWTRVHGSAEARSFHLAPL